MYVLYFFEDKMKYYYCSDLHLDNYYNMTRLDKFYYPAILTSNVKEHLKSTLIIAGDLCVKTLMWRHKELLREICSKFKMVLYVEGNHENYKWDMSVKYDYSNIADNFFILNDSFIETKDAILYGGTMWADLNDISKLDEFNLSTMINDFKCIYTNNTDLISVADCASKYNAFVENLYEAQLYADSKNKKLIVISHFAPSMKSVTPGYEKDALNIYFCNQLDLMIENSNIKAWVHGHVHSSHDYIIGNTRILCNPRGYPSQSIRFKLKHFIV